MKRPRLRESVWSSVKMAVKGEDVYDGHGSVALHGV
jgi:hypothetical protein